MFRNISSRDYNLSRGYFVIWQENDFVVRADVFVVVDDVGNHVDEFNDVFGEGVSRSGFSSEERYFLV